GSQKASAPSRQRFFGGGGLPFRVLLDQPLQGKGIRPYEFKPGDKGSGRSADTYEVMSWPSTFVIGKDGTLVGKFELEALEGALEEQFGLPRTRAAEKPATGRFEPPQPPRVAVKGGVVGPEGKPVAGAKLSSMRIRIREKEVTTGPGGEFAFTAEHVTLGFTVKVEAAGLAPRLFKIEATGEVPQPLQLGRGV